MFSSSNPLYHYFRLHRKDEPVDVGVVAERLGVRLTACEKELLKSKLDFNKDGIITYNNFAIASKHALDERTMREICLYVVLSLIVYTLLTIQSKSYHCIHLISDDRYVDKLLSNRQVQQLNWGPALSS